MRVVIRDRNGVWIATAELPFLPAPGTLFGVQMEKDGHVHKLPILEVFIGNQGRRYDPDIGYTLVDFAAELKIDCDAKDTVYYERTNYHELEKH